MVKFVQNIAWCFTLFQDLLNGIQEVGGSIPPGSTISENAFRLFFSGLEGVSRGSERSVTL